MMDKKEQRELEFFYRFLELAKLPIDPASVHNARPPSSDIRCLTWQGDGVHFEMVELDDFGFRSFQGSREGALCALEEAFEEIQARRGFFYRLEVEMVGNDRKTGEAPLAPFFIHLIREAEFDEVADCGGDDVLVVFEIIILAGELAESFGEIAGDGWLFGYDQGLGHGAKRF